MTDIQKAATTAARYVFALVLLAYALLCLRHEQAPKVTDVHAILAGVALLLLPDLPAHLASAVQTVGGAGVDLYNRWKNPPAGSGGAP